MRRPIINIDTAVMPPPGDNIERTAMPVFVGENTDVLLKSVIVRGRSFPEIKAEINKTKAKWSDRFQKSVISFFANGGEICYVMLRSHFNRVAVQNGLIAEVERDVPEATLLVIPELIGYKGNWEHILTEEARSHRLFCIIDLPRSPGDARSEALGFSRSMPNNAKSAGAAYWPYIIERIVDGDAVDEHRVPPSGAVAAAIQRTDKAGGVWTAPAAITLPAVLQVDEHEGQADLYDEGINTVRIFPGRGALVWGARTFLSDTKNPGAYVQTQRTVVFIENGLKAQLRPMVFDVNDALLWRTCEARVTVWLTELWRAGGLAGATPEEAFSVRVGEGVTMTPTDIANGKLILHVRFSLHPVVAEVMLTLTMFHGESHVAVSRTEDTRAGASQ